MTIKIISIIVLNANYWASNWIELNRSALMLVLVWYESNLNSNKIKLNIKQFWTRSSYCYRCMEAQRAHHFSLSHLPPRPTHSVSPLLPNPKSQRDLQILFRSWFPTIFSAHIIWFYSYNQLTSFCLISISFSFPKSQPPPILHFIFLRGKVKAKVKKSGWVH